MITGVPITGMAPSAYKGSLLIPAVDTSLALNMQNVSIAASGLMLGTGFQVSSYTANISASGTTQGAAVLLTTQLNAVTSVYASGGVILPNVVPGAVVRVFHEDNYSGYTLAIYPPVGQYISLLGMNNPSGMIYGQVNDFNYLGSNQWYIK
jgi:hypothetical protein